MKKTLTIILLIIASMFLVSCKGTKEISVTQAKEEIAGMILPTNSVFVAKAEFSHIEQYKDINTNLKLSTKYHTNYDNRESLEGTKIETVTGNHMSSKSKQTYKAFTDLNKIYVDGTDGENTYYEEKMNYNTNLHKIIFNSVLGLVEFNTLKLEKLASHPFSKMYLSKNKLTIEVKLNEQMKELEGLYINQLLSILDLDSLKSNHEIVTLDYKIEITFDGYYFVQSKSNLNYHTKNSRNDDYVKTNISEIYKFQDKLPKVFNYSKYLES